MRYQLYSGMPFISPRHMILVSLNLCAFVFVASNLRFIFCVSFGKPRLNA